MAHIRALRLDRGLTLTELALVSGIPARLLAQLEHGLLPLDPQQHRQLANVFNVAPATLTAVAQPPVTSAQRVLQPALAAAMLGLAAMLMVNTPLPSVALPAQPSRTQAPASAPAPFVQPAPRAQSAAVDAAELAAMQRELRAARPRITRAPSAAVDAAELAAMQRELRTARSIATVQPAPTFELRADGPHGCPLLTTQRLLLTQGYGEGTHAPAATMGAIDLVIDADGNGHDEPEATRGMPVLATLGGVARVFFNSWPGGNFVLIVNERASWSTAYAHLDSVLVADGQTVVTGAQIGTVGSTGMASGPHLHYEVRSVSGNVDPAPLLQCGL